MQQAFKKFLLRLALLAAIVELVTILYLFLSDAVIKNIYLLAISPFFFLLIALIHSILIKASENNFRTFVSRYMLSVVVKLMICLLIILLMLLLAPQIAFVFSLCFALQYIIFSIFETIALVYYKPRKN